MIGMDSGPIEIPPENPVPRPMDAGSQNPVLRVFKGVAMGGRIPAYWNEIHLSID